MRLFTQCTGFGQSPKESLHTWANPPNENLIHTVENRQASNRFLKSLSLSSFNEASRAS